MELIQILILALVQGLTEFLPISSSAHLILAPHLFGFNDQGLAFDVAVHLGSLLAVIGYFRREIVAVTHDWFLNLFKNAPQTANSRLGTLILLGSVPIAILGLLAKSLVEGEFRSPLVIAAATVIFGLLLWHADRDGRRVRHINLMEWRDALFIGCMQALALIPGTSRSGITMTAALMLGYTREAASRFSFLLSIPAILMSAILVINELLQSSGPVDWQSLTLGILLSFTAALTCIHYFLKFIERVGMAPFVYYRLLLGVAILYFVYA